MIGAAFRWFGKWIKEAEARAAAAIKIGQADPAPALAIGWECKDYADGWIKYSRPADALRYQDETGCLLRVTYRAAPAPHKEQQK